MNRRLVALTVAGALAGLGAWRAEACTSMIFKAEDGTRIYARTMEWGASDLKSEMMLAPRGLAFSSDLGDSKSGAAWSARYGFVGVNADGLPYATDGMNEAGLTVGALFFPGFAQYQEPKAAEQSTTVSNVDLVNYILSNFKTVEEVREAMPKLRVVRNAAIEKEFGTPLPLHHIVSDATGASIVIEYMDGKLSMHDNKVGAMTNSPGYEWHLLNLRNYANLTPQAARPHAIDGVSLAPFGAGSGMLGLPGDFTPPSRFVRAVAFVNTMIPAKTAADAVNAASVMLNNFDIPKGLVREGASPEDFHLGYTQWSVIADMTHRVYYYWTMYDRRMRSVDLAKLDFGKQGDRVFPPRQGPHRGHSRPLKRLRALNDCAPRRKPTFSPPRGSAPPPLACTSTASARPGSPPARRGEGGGFASPFAQQDHFAHDVLIRQSVAGVLAARDRDLDGVGNIAREPDVRPAGRRPARPDGHRPAGKADARAAGAAIAAAHEAGKRARLQTVACDPAVDHHLRRIDAVAMAHRPGVAVLALRPGGPGERVLPAKAIPIIDLEGEREHVRPAADGSDIGLRRRA